MSVKIWRIRRPHYWIPAILQLLWNTVLVVAVELFAGGEKIPGAQGTTCWLGIVHYTSAVTLLPAATKNDAFMGIFLRLKKNNAPFVMTHLLNIRMWISGADLLFMCRWQVAVKATKLPPTSSAVFSWMMGLSPIIFD
jgi:hypothetical protein